MALDSLSKVRDPSPPSPSPSPFPLPIVPPVLSSTLSVVFVLPSIVAGAFLCIFFSVDPQICTPFIFFSRYLLSNPQSSPRRPLVFGFVPKSPRTTESICDPRTTESIFGLHSTRSEISPDRNPNPNTDRIPNPNTERIPNPNTD
ncbi:hypothetical protein I3843_14G047800 [Carya illinoinensis]|nr:hypothetical protein I3843_14G047800 [Carya illinoinensis]